jgi:hypothetical protein
MRVRMLIPVPGVLGGATGSYTDVERGQVVDVPEATALGYVKSGIAQTDLTGPLGQPYKPAT